jgi:hypothetical protein
MSSGYCIGFQEIQLLASGFIPQIVTGSNIPNVRGIQEIVVIRINFANNELVSNNCHLGTEKSTKISQHESNSSIGVQYSASI